MNGYRNFVVTITALLLQKPRRSVSMLLFVPPSRIYQQQLRRRHNNNNASRNFYYSSKYRDRLFGGILAARPSSNNNKSAAIMQMVCRNIKSSSLRLECCPSILLLSKRSARIRRSTFLYSKTHRCRTTTTTGSTASDYHENDDPIGTNDRSSSSSSSSSMSGTTTTKQQQQEHQRLLLQQLSSPSSSSSPTITTATVAETLRTSLEMFEEEATEGGQQQQQFETLEPVMSTVHLLSIALQLPWESGYRDLLSIVHNHIHNKSKNHHDDALDATDTYHSSIGSHNNSVQLSNRILTSDELQLFHSHLYRRMIRKEPIQYICRQWDFYDATFAIRAPLLCPRPETEELTSYAIQDIRSMTNGSHHDITGNPFVQQQQQRPIHVLDIGCGTGCIGISIAKAVPEAIVTAIDVEPIAVQVSNQNAQSILGSTTMTTTVSKRNATTTTTAGTSRYMAHLIDIEQFGNDIKNRIHNDANGNDVVPPLLLYDIVVSNPPYILPSDMGTLDASVHDYESHVALNGGGPDGLNVIRIIVQQLPYICNPSAICWIEVDPSQPKLIQEYCIQQQQEYHPDSDIRATVVSGGDEHEVNTDSNVDNTNKKKKIVRYVETVKDMFGLDRFVKLQVVVGVEPEQIR